MFKVLLMAFLLWNGTPIQPPIAMGLPDMEFASAVECGETLDSEDFAKAAQDLFVDFLQDKVPAGASVAVIGKCLPAAEAEAAMPKGQSI